MWRDVLYRPRAGVILLPRCASHLSSVGQLHRPPLLDLPHKNICDTGIHVRDEMARVRGCVDARGCVDVCAK